MLALLQNNFLWSHTFVIHSVYVLLEGLAETYGLLDQCRLSLIRRNNIEVLIRANEFGLGFTN